MRPKDGFCHGTGFEQAETEQDGITNDCPNRADGIAGNRYILYQHGIDGNTDEDEKALKSQCEQAFQIVLSHVALLVVAPCCHGNRRKAHHAVNFDHASVHNDKNNDA